MVAAIVEVLAIDGDENEVDSGRAQGDFGKAEKHRVGHNGLQC